MFVLLMTRFVEAVVVTVQGEGFADPFSKPGFPSNCVVVFPPPPPAAVTATETEVVCVTPPPVALTVALNVPVVAVPAAENVSVEFPLPGAAMEVGLKLAVTPAGRPETDNETAELKPPTVALDMLVVPEEPWAIERLVGEALRIKSGVCVDATVTGTVAV